MLPTSPAPNDAPPALSLCAAKNARLTPDKREALQRAILFADNAAWELRRQGVVPPEAYRPICVAQFLLESGWGVHDAGGANNYFGIKALPGEPFVELPTEEVVHGQRVKTTARFRKFDSPTACFVAHARLLCTARVYAAFRAAGDDVAQAARALQGVYATDPAYATKLLRVVVDRGLCEAFGLHVPARP